MTMAPTAKYRTTPTPNPSPQGGGEHTARAAPSLMLTRRSLLAVSAAAMLAVIPVFILGLLVQRFLVRGLTLGAVKG